MPIEPVNSWLFAKPVSAGHLGHALDGIKSTAGLLGKPIVPRMRAQGVGQSVRRRAG